MKQLIMPGHGGAVLAAGLDNIPGIDGLGGLVPPCAPDERSNTRHENKNIITQFAVCTSLLWSLRSLGSKFLYHFLRSRPRFSNKFLKVTIYMGSWSQGSYEKVFFKA